MNNHIIHVLVHPIQVLTHSCFFILFYGEIFRGIFRDKFPIFQRKNSQEMFFKEIFLSHFNISVQFLQHLFTFFLQFEQCFFGMIHNDVTSFWSQIFNKWIPLNPAHQDLSFQQHQRHIPIPPKFSAMI
jgi:hypothetical protein